MDVQCMCVDVCGGGWAYVQCMCTSVGVCVRSDDGRQKRVP